MKTAIRSLNGIHRGFRRAGGILVACALLFAACKKDDDDNEPEPVTWGERYAVCVTENPENMPLPTLAGKTIKQVVYIEDGETDWLDVAPAATVGGVPSVDITLKEWRPTGLVDEGDGDTWETAERHHGTKDSVVVQTTDGAGLLLVINQAHIDPPETRADAEAPTRAPTPVATFMTNWETATSVTLYNGSDPLVVNLPWASSYNVSFLADMRKDMKAADGWQMAFCLFQGGDQKFNYFGLSNKYTGILRVFYYQPTVTSQGGEVSFLITPNSHSTPKYSYYHTWQYGIPANHTNVHNMKNPYNVSTNSSETFQNLIVPYSAASKCILTIGWYAFDLDLSFYSPSGATRFSTGDGLQFNGQTQSNTSITLNGSLTGTITDPPAAPQKTGTSGILGWVGDVSNGLTNTSRAAMSGDYFGMATSLIGNAFSLGSKIDAASGAKGTGAVSHDLNAKIDLSGYLTTSTSNNMMSAGFDYDDMFKNAVQGVWSLQSDPILRVATNMIVGNDVGHNYSMIAVYHTSEARHAYGTGWYDYFPDSGPSPAGWQLRPRMVAWIDPASIRINLNTALFPSISDVNVTWTYGSYNAPKIYFDPEVNNPNPLGYTNPVRSMLGIPLVGGSDDAARSEWWWNNFHYPSMPSHVTQSLDYFLSPDIWNGAGEYWGLIHVPYNGAYDFYLYGAAAKDANSNWFVYDPQVLCATENTANFYEPIIPDFVVLVTLTFKYKDANGKEQTGIFSKRFLPTLSFGGINMSKELSDISTYETACKNGATIQTINGVPVTHKGSHPMVYKIKRVCELPYRQ